MQNDNLFFTVDQGRDAVYVREILNSQAIFLKGPETSVRGLFTGPLWYYFIAIGYAITQGHPAGSVLILSILNLVITLVLIWQVKKHIDWKLALIIGIGLQIFWPFFVTSLYGFNPFPVVALAIILILLLVHGRYRLALLPIILAFNTEMAGAVVFLIFYILVGLYLVLYKKLTRRNFFVFALGIPILGITKFVFDFLRHKSVTANAGLQVFSSTNFTEVFKEFLELIGSVIPQQTTVGFLLVVILVIVYAKQKKKNEFVKRFAYLSFILMIISYIFFGSNMGWREWHTVYIPVLTLVATLLMCYETKRIGQIIFVIILLLNIINFKDKYLEYLKPTDNPGLLYNQKRVLDWIYTNNEENGFNLYTYTHTFYDYNYQYLISYYAKDKYGFYPCEYANYPLSHKYLYIPGEEKYDEPKLGCDKFRFLIIESDTNGNENKNWIEEFRKQTIFIDQTQIANTTIEKRATTDIIK